MQNMSSLHSDVAHVHAEVGVVLKNVGEEKWKREVEKRGEEEKRVGVGGEAGEIGLCKTTDMVAQHGPTSAAGSSSPGGEQVTLQMIWEKLCCLEEVVRGKAFHEEVRAGAEVSGAKQKIEKLEEKNEKDEKEDPWKAASEDLAGAIATGKPIRGRITKWFPERRLWVCRGG